MKKIVALILTLALVLTSGTAIFAADSVAPEDVKGASYEAAVTALVEKGIVVGETDGLFYPDNFLTRAQACIMVVKAMNAPAAEIVGTATQKVPKSRFKDMAGYGWAEGYISYAVKEGVVSGYPDGTFKPGNQVTMHELLTMVVRAAGYREDQVTGTWPTNYYSKAIELEILGAIPAPLPEKATRWMAASVIYDALPMIEEANPAPEAPGQGTDKDKPSNIPDTDNMTYANSKFNDSMTTFDGKTIAKDVIVYTYGVAADYSRDMEFSDKASDYRLETVYKFKNVKTPAYYTLSANNQITTMVVPMDVGFTGLIYGVINGTVTTLNADDEAVTGIETLTAGKPITWLAQKTPETDIPTSGAIGTGYLDGSIYEMSARNGTIRSIYKATDSYKGKRFVELTAGEYKEVESYENGIFVINGHAYEVKPNASVYVIDKVKLDEYKVGSLSSIRKGVEIRAYDISDDDEDSADIIIVKR
ncbi:MAG: S-layer homology domain-containing protein [Anaerovoracaceae bacterium]|jgi:hypothetical protein